MIASIYRVIGWIWVVLTLAVIIIAVITVFVSGTYFGEGVFGFLGELLGDVFGSLVVIFIYGAIGTLISLAPFALAEAIDVFVDIERNTRR
jgi:hypothetical protein